MKKLLYCLFLIPSFSYAIPTITISTGIFQNNSTITIRGAGFQVKALTSTIFDDVEPGHLANGFWNSTNNLSTSNVKLRGLSNYSAYHNFKAGTGDSAYVTARNAWTSQKWFISYWVYVSTNFDWGTTTFGGGDQFLSNIKVIRWWNPATTTMNVVGAYQGWANNEILTVENVLNDPNRSIMSGWRTMFTPGTWHNFQFRYSENSNYAIKDGTFEQYFDGQVVYSSAGINTRDSGADTSDGINYKRPFIIGFYNAWSQDTDKGDNEIWFDDFYVSNEWKRVEIGNNPVYANCTHREMQIPTVWNDDQVDIVVKQDALTSDGTVYAFICDEDNNCTSGYQLNNFPESGGGNSTFSGRMTIRGQVTIR